MIDVFEVWKKSLTWIAQVYQIPKNRQEHFVQDHLADLWWISSNVKSQIPMESVLATDPYIIYRLLFLASVLSEAQEYEIVTDEEFSQAAVMKLDVPGEPRKYLLN